MSPFASNTFLNTVNAVAIDSASKGFPDSIS